LAVLSIGVLGDVRLAAVGA